MTPPLSYPLETRFEKSWPTQHWCDSHVVLAVSGGSDSVAMARAAVALKNSRGGTGRLFVAHLNHALRGADANADAAWLQVLCDRLNVPLEIGKTDVAALAAQRGDGLEAAARAARYDFLQRTAERLGARFVAVAHTADDQVETVLHRVVRGTGLAGLAGIPGSRPLSPSVTLVRPLLGVRRTEVLDYLAAIEQDYRTDWSNSDPRWTRNRLRHELLPLLRCHYNADVDSALLRLAAQASEWQQLMADLSAEVARECTAIEFGGTSAADPCRMAKGARIDCRALVDYSPLVVREVCRVAWNEANWPQQAMGFKQWQQLAEMVCGDCVVRSLNLPGNIRVRREQDYLVLEMLGLP